MSGKVRADGEGSVFFEGRAGSTGFWVAAVPYVDAGGKRRSRRVRRKTKSAAQQALKEMRGRRDAEQPLRDSSVTVGDWSRRWELTALAASRRRATTKATYSTLLKTCVRPHLQYVRLDLLRPSDVEAWLMALEGQGLSASTRRQSLTILRGCLNDAVRDGLLARNPTAGVTRPPLRRAEAVWYSPGQVGALLNAADDHRLRHLLLALAGTGLRRGEALALTWPNIDLERPELRVRGTLVRVNGGLIVHPPKTPRGWRTVPLSAPVREALAAQRQQQRLERVKAGPSWIGSEHVFTTEAGTPLDPRNVSRWFAKLTTLAGVGGSLHTLRHTALSGMAEAGAPLSTVSRVAGHESITTTIDLYGHVSEQSARDAVDAAAAALGLSQPAAQAPQASGGQGREETWRA